MTQSSLSREHKQAFGLRQFLSHDEIARRDRFCSAGQHPFATTTIFFPWPFLNSSNRPRYAATISLAVRRFENPEARHTFAQACLIASDLWSRRVCGGNARGSVESSGSRVTHSYDTFLYLASSCLGGAHASNCRMRPESACDQ